MPHHTQDSKRRKGHIITSSTIKLSVAEDEVCNLEPSREESVLRGSSLLGGEQKSY